MTIKELRNHVPAVAISRRRLISRAVAAASALTLASVPRAVHPVAAQTPVATPAAPIPNTVASDASPRFRAVADALLAAMPANGTPGAALGILADGVEEHATFGVDSIDARQPVTAETLFQIGSITKTLTGTAIMRLVEDVALDLDATVRTYLPDFELAEEDVAARVTVRHLLTHTGGWWGDFFADTGADDDAIARYIERWFPTLPQLTPLDEYVNYNNAGFTLLGRLIEEATGEEYRVAMGALVLEPLGLSGSFFAPEEVLARPHAQGHFTENGATLLQEPLFLPRAVDPAGGLWSTTSDLLRYARFHLGDGTSDGERILSAELLAQMQTPQQPFLGQPGTAIGMPWVIVDLAGQRFVQHDGGTFGQGAMLLLAPDRGFAIAVLTNALPGGAYVGQAALLEAFTRYIGLDLERAAMATPAANPPPAAAPPPDLDQYVGRYEAPDTVVELVVENGALVLNYELRPLPEQVQPTLISEVPPRAPVEFIADDVILVTIAGLPLPVAFVRRDDGSIGWIAAAGRMLPKVETA